MSDQRGVIVSSQLNVDGAKRRLSTDTYKLESTKNGSVPPSSIVSLSRPTNVDTQMRNIAAAHDEYTIATFGWGWLADTVMDKNKFAYSYFYNFN